MDARSDGNRLHQPGAVLTSGAVEHDHIPFPFHERRIHPALSPEENRVPGHFWLIFLGLCGLALGLVCWGAYRHLNPEKSLREGRLASTLGMVEAPQDAKPSEPVRIVLNELPPAIEPPPVVRAEAVVPPPVALPPIAPPPVEPPPPPPVAPPPVAPPPLETPKIELPKVELPKIDLPQAELPKPPPVELPPPIVEGPKPPVAPPEIVEDYPLILTRALDTGDSPMLRNWKMLAIYSLTVVVVSQPAPVAAGDDQKKVTDRLDKLDAAITSIAESFKAVGADIKSINTDVGAVKNQLTKLQADLSALQSETLASKLKIDGMAGKLEAFETSLGKMQKEIDTLKKRLDDPSRVSSDKAALDELKTKIAALEKAIAALPATSRVALSPPTGTTGRVMLVNNYPEMLLFILNGQTFRVAGNTIQPIDGVPAGSLTYEVISPTWGRRAFRTTTLGANETFTLTAQ